ncbi:uncharacterized protein SAPINGB_P003016 [Magnusiomyces paraingens]|uniref:Putative peptidase domain-containing protein n=1 Tax=Magnusiomyces paraingens TaxID=2606893 RepID=A0A5E8BHP9_9ASCO|nr:uncharacterized protein SAPINGB_P003016 [Saprochaete ingens]VVT51196.1 unnamed protein product [Saprochaete ingens]
MFANSFAAIAFFFAVANGLPVPQNSTPTFSSVSSSSSASASASASTSSASSAVASTAVSSYNWNDGFTPTISIRSSCNATNSNILSRALSDTIDVAQHARLHLLRYGNSSDIFPRYFGNASAAAEPLGWYDFLANGDKSGLVLRCDDVDDRCNDTTTGIYTYRDNESVICPNAFSNKIYNSDICAHGYTVAGNNATDTWAGTFLGQLLNSQRIGQGSISHKAESYASVIALAKSNSSVALHNTASLQYFALHAWAYDIAVPGAGCTGKYSNASLATNSTLASSSNTTVSTNTTVSSNSTSTAAQRQTASNSSAASQSLLVVTGSSVSTSTSGSTRTVTSSVTASGSSSYSSISATPSAIPSSLSATASGVTRTVTESVTSPISSSARVTVTESVTATPSSSVNSVTRTVTESVTQTPEVTKSTSASRRTIVVTDTQSSS